VTVILHVSQSHFQSYTINRRNAVLLLKVQKTYILRGPKKGKKYFFKFSLPPLVVDALGNHCANFSEFLMKTVI
jgi:hypothetical protein